ncbi:hypothetical protein HDU76_012373 [Blyttiomyces sp. JEL0837]|nr:hypothetical protein HDU76_012373 [Blyttiomyces sp. JEL0837]
MNSTAWDSHSSTYESSFAYNTSLFGLSAITLAQIPSNTQTTTEKPCTIIDIACGPGNLAIELCKRGHTVLATDFSPKFISMVQSKAESLNLLHNLKPFEADGQSLDGVPDNLYDYAISNFGLFMFPERLQGYLAAKRVLKPDGLLVVTAWDESFMSFQAVKHVRRKLGHLMNIAAYINPTGNTETFKKDVENAGFVDVTVRTITHEFVYGTAEELILATFDNPGFASLVGDDPDGTRREVAMRGYLEAVVGVEKVPEGGKLEDLPVWKEPVHFQGVAHVCIGRKPKE